MSISTDGQGGHAAPEWDLVDRLTKSLRIAGMSGKDMAAYLEVHRNTVSGWMNGDAQPSRPMMITWALRTGVPFEWLRDGVISPPSPPTNGGQPGHKPGG